MSTTLLTKELRSFDLFPDSFTNYSLTETVSNLQFINVQVSNTYAVRLSGQSGNETTVYAQALDSSNNVLGTSNDVILGVNTRTTVGFNITSLPNSNNVTQIRLLNKGSINWCNAESTQTLTVIGI